MKSNSTPVPVKTTRTIMANASSEHRPKRILKFSATLLVLALLAYPALLVSQSWRGHKSHPAIQLATIADLSANAIDRYLTQLEIGMQNLGADLAGTHKKLDLDRAYKLVNRFQTLHTELGNVMLIRSDGQILLTGNIPGNRDLPTLAKDSAFMRFRGELQQGPSFVIGQPVLGHIDNSWVVSARYAVTDQTGTLPYILSAHLPANMLQRCPLQVNVHSIPPVQRGGAGPLEDIPSPEPDAASL